MKKCVPYLFVWLCIMVFLGMSSGLAQEADQSSPTPEPTVSEAEEAPQEQTPAAEETGDEEAEFEKLNINFATLDDLRQLPGMTDEIAQSVLKNRPYKQVEDLLQIEGIDDEFLAAILEFVEISPLNINDATIEELQMLPDIDEQTARMIIRGRPYKIVEELLKIRGLGEKRLAKFRDLIDARPARPGRAERRGWNIKKRTYPIKQRIETRPEDEEEEPEETTTP